MRIVAWNCKGAFHRKHGAAADLRPDVLMVPECEQLSAVFQTPGTQPARSFEWFGADPRKGLGVFTYGDYAMQLHPSYDPRHRWIIPLSISGPDSFLLFAVWTLPHADSRSYVQPLIEAFEHYKPLIEASPTIWGGDFNAGLGFDRPSSPFKFRDFVTLLEGCGLRSLYHEQRRCPYGVEPEHTYYHRHAADQGFHIDYMFAGRSFRPGAFTLSVGAHADWAKQSDHMPLICEFHEEMGRHGNERQSP